ncbi:hypothetical protein ElyMa_006739800, partial [Elysia marginata]
PQLLQPGSVKRMSGFQEGPLATTANIGLKRPHSLNIGYYNCASVEGVWLIKTYIPLSGLWQTSSQFLSTSMAKKKGHKGQKKLQGPKLKAAKKVKKAKVAKASGKIKAKKGGSKAVATNLKKMSFNNSKKVELLNTDITKVLLAPPKLNFLSSVATAGPSNSKQRKPVKDDDRDMVDVSAVEQKLAAM